MIHTISEIIKLFIVSGTISTLSLILWRIDDIFPYWEVVIQIITISNIIFISTIDIANGWKIFFAVGFVITMLDPVIALMLMFAGPYIINCMFPEAIIDALQKYIFTTAWVSNKIYMRFDLIIPDIENKIVLFVFCTIVFIAIIFNGFALCMKRH